jgi:hypothetical protein
VNIPLRDPAAKSNLLDLSAWYNVSLQGDWPEAGRRKSWASLPTGLQTFAGTEFDVRGLIQLRALSPATAAYPPRVDGIRVGMRCSKLHFLHNVIDAGRLVRAGTPLGAYVLHYSDGETFAVPIRLAVNILDWWGSPAQLPEGVPAVLAWEGNLPTNRRIALTKFTLENPRPEVEVTTLDFGSEGKTKAAPFLIAITAEP